MDAGNQPNGKAAALRIRGEFEHRKILAKMKETKLTPAELKAIKDIPRNYPKSKS